MSVLTTKSTEPDVHHQEWYEDIVDRHPDLWLTRTILYRHDDDGNLDIWVQHIEDGADRGIDCGYITLAPDGGVRVTLECETVPVALADKITIAHLLMLGLARDLSANSPTPPGAA